jgi:mRNA interferase MazF
MEKDFETWQSKKQQLHERNTQNIFFHQKEIWWCSVGCNIGTEIDGKHSDFERPVLIIKKINRHQFIGLPLTTSAKHLESTRKIIISTGSYVVLSQIRTLSVKRLCRKIKKINRTEFELLKCQVKGYL